MKGKKSLCPKTCDHFNAFNVEAVASYKHYIPFVLKEIRKAYP